MSGAEIVELHVQMRRLAEQLIRDFQPTVAAGTVIRTVMESCEALRQAGMSAGLEPAVAAMARHRLSELTLRSAVQR